MNKVFFESLRTTPKTDNLLATCLRHFQIIKFQLDFDFIKYGR